jgi:hypothetical protein
MSAMGRKRPLASGRKPDIAGHGSQGTIRTSAMGGERSLASRPQTGPEVRPLTVQIGVPLIARKARGI